MWTVLTLVVVGAALLLLETMLPGLVAGILGLCCLVAAVFSSYYNFGTHTGNVVLLGLVLALVGGTALWIRVFPGTRLAKVFISQRIVGDLDVDKPELLHEMGVALSNLRPSGIALIAGKRVDVVTEGPMVERGTPVKVIAVEGMRVVVRAASERPLD